MNENLIQFTLRNGLYEIIFEKSLNLKFADLHFLRVVGNQCLICRSCSTNFSDWLKGTTIGKAERNDGNKGGPKKEDSSVCWKTNRQILFRYLQKFT